jgi:uracil phosphoribosyltransferase
MNPMQQAGAVGDFMSSNILFRGKMSVPRDKTTATVRFRRTLKEIAILLLTEASRKWPTRAVEIKTPLAALRGATLARPVVFAPILRAGLGLLEGMLRLLPDAEIGHIGLYRDEATLRPVNYYCRHAPGLAESQVVLLDPMLATGRSATEAATLLKAQGATDIQFICVVACEVGIEHLRNATSKYPDLLRRNRSRVE